MVKYFFYLSLLCLLTLTACKRFVFSFESGSLHPDVKTITIRPFFNESGGGPPNMEVEFTEKLKEFFQQNTNLSIVNENGHITLEGSINNFGISPIAPQANETAAFNRLTIGVNAIYLNVLETDEEKNNFDQNFSFFADFPQGQALSDAEAELLDEIFDQIILDIYNRVTAGDDW